MIEGQEVLAKTIYGEARGESVRGQEAVAAVVMNRKAVADRHGGWFWWGGTVQNICRKPRQFSCWNADDPNRKMLTELDANNPNPSFAVALRIAERAICGALADPTNGATHYHAESVRPKWAKDAIPCAHIGRHLFYKAKVAGGDVE